MASEQTERQRDLIMEDAHWMTELPEDVERAIKFLRLTLCVLCGGNGTRKIPGGITVCESCDGLCYAIDGTTVLRQSIAAALSEARTTSVPMSDTEWRLTSEDLHRIVNSAGAGNDLAWAVKDLIEAHYHMDAYKQSIAELEAALSKEREALFVAREDLRYANESVIPERDKQIAELRANLEEAEKENDQLIMSTKTGQRIGDEELERACVTAANAEKLGWVLSLENEKWLDLRDARDLIAELREKLAEATRQRDEVELQVKIERSLRDLAREQRDEAEAAIRVVHDRFFSSRGDILATTECYCLICDRIRSRKANEPEV